MDDLIRRQDAIELAMQYCPDDDGSCSKAGADIREMLDELEDLPSAQPEQKWIPCSERLPDSRRSVLITVSNGKDYETSEAYYHELRKDWFEVNGDRVCEMSPPWKTIAWCELPEPWKGEEE